LLSLPIQKSNHRSTYGSCTISTEPARRGRQAGYLLERWSVVAVAPTLHIDPATLYAIFSLRSQVFVVEQACPYWDLDGRDLEPGCLQLWHEEPSEGVVGTARLLSDGDRCRFGRLCTAPAARNRGLAASVLGAALGQAGDRPVVLDAQSHLANWYERFGFRRTGHEHIDVGIPHVEMIRDGGAPSA